LLKKRVGPGKTDSMPFTVLGKRKEPKVIIATSDRGEGEGKKVFETRKNFRKGGGVKGASLAY